MTEQEKELEAIEAAAIKKSRGRPRKEVGVDVGYDAAPAVEKVEVKNDAVHSFWQPPAPSSNTEKELELLEEIFQGMVKVDQRKILSMGHILRKVRELKLLREKLKNSPSA